MGKEELRWSVQNMPVQDWRGTQRESLGNVICASKVKLQHLPFQVGHSLGSAEPCARGSPRAPFTPVLINGTRFVTAPLAPLRCQGVARVRNERLEAGVAAGDCGLAAAGLCPWG